MSKITDNGNVVKYILFPTLFISFIGIFIFEAVRLPLALYVVMGLWSLNAYRDKKYQEEIYGIRKGVLKDYIIGGSIGVGFLILFAIAPFFALLSPAIPLSVSSDIRFMIIVILAPLLEESWRSATMGYIRDIYKTSFAKTNVIQAIGFGALHVLVYGLGFSAYDQWTQVYGTFLAISGSLVGAVSFGLVSGFMMEKFKGIVPSIGAHQVINFWLVQSGLVVISVSLPLIKNMVLLIASII